MPGGLAAIWGKADAGCGQIMITEEKRAYRTLFFRDHGQRPVTAASGVLGGADRDRDGLWGDAEDSRVPPAGSSGGQEAAGDVLDESYRWLRRDCGTRPAG